MSFFGNAANAQTADVRVDEEAKEKFQAILDLLLAGGYFRARIQGLSPFDKVIGGMAWAITSAAGDLDIDIFFQENAQIGQKIKLGEQILDGLSRLGCKIRLQSHQIQGLDFASIFPVIQWLITKVIEVRAETGDLVRAYSEAQFSKAYLIPSEITFKENKPKATAFVGQIEDKYRPRRQYVRRADGRRLPESEEVALVMMEYGTRGNVSVDTSTNKSNDGDDDGNEEAAAYAARMARLATLGGDELSASAMDGYLPSAQMQQLLDSYEATLGGDSGVSGLSGAKLAARQHAARVAKLERQVAEVKERGKALNAANKEAAAEHASLATQLKEKEVYIERLKNAIGELEALETPENAPLIKQLKQLVALNEALVAHETAFRRRCAAELHRFKERIAELQKIAAETASEGGEAEREALLADAERKDAAKFAKVKRALAERRCAIAAAERKLDTVPSRAELQQYQRQFVELYEKIAAREVETRRYFNTFNTLEDTRTFLAKETSIYNSILDNFQQAMKSKKARQELVTSMAGIVKSVVENLEKVDGKLQTEIEKKHAAAEAYKQLVDKERTYFKLAKQFQEACALNEKLENEITQLESEAKARA